MKNEITIRLSIFFGALIIFSLWEWIRPRRKLKEAKGVRRFTNFSMALINNLLIRVLIPFTTLSTAVIAQENNWGILPYFNLPLIFMIIGSIIILDFLIYFQHRLFHTSPFLWRFHQVHHLDKDCDVTTGIRFHFVEIGLSVAIKSIAIIFFGIPAIAVLVFEIVINTTSMFNHGNILLPFRIDQYLQYFLVTPDMHRIHHSIESKEMNSNFGFNLSLWDRLFKTYRKKSYNKQEDLIIGTNSFKEQKYQYLHWLLIQPFIKSKR